MAEKSAISIPKTKKVKILSTAKQNLPKNGHEISTADVIANLNQVEAIADIMIDEMFGSKNKYYLDLMREFGNNKK